MYKIFKNSGNYKVQAHAIYELIDIFNIAQKTIIETQRFIAQNMIFHAVLGNIINLTTQVENTNSSSMPTAINHCFTSFQQLSKLGSGFDILNDDCRTFFTQICNFQFNRPMDTAFKKDFKSYLGEEIREFRAHYGVNEEIILSAATILSKDKNNIQTFYNDQLDNYEYHKKQIRSLQEQVKSLWDSSENDSNLVIYNNFLNETISSMDKNMDSTNDFFQQLKQTLDFSNTNELKTNTSTPTYNANNKKDNYISTNDNLMQNSKKITSFKLEHFDTNTLNKESFNGIKNNQDYEELTQKTEDTINNIREILNEEIFLSRDLKELTQKLNNNYTRDRQERYNSTLIHTNYEEKFLTEAVEDTQNLGKEYNEVLTIAKKDKEIQSDKKIEVKDINDFNDSTYEKLKLKDNMNIFINENNTVNTENLNTFRSNCIQKIQKDMDNVKDQIQEVSELWNKSGNQEFATHQKAQLDKMFDLVDSAHTTIALDFGGIMFIENELNQKLDKTKQKDKTVLQQINKKNN